MSHPERIVPDETESGVVALHLKRYDFARPRCVGAVVLDAGCGVGYGAAQLAEVAESVIGVDVDPESIAYARRRYDAENVEFLVADLAALPLAAGAVDIVCMFEVIEHLPDREAALAEVARVLRPEGAFFVSTPRADRTTHAPANPFHLVEYSQADFEQLLHAYFDGVELYGQRRPETRRHRLARRLDVLGLRRRLPFLTRASRRLTGTAATAELAADDVVISAEAVDRATELLAVCTRPRRP
jgi:SAM-dependent methyltransferase